MDATPALLEVGRQLHAVKLDVVLIGNAAAALQGAPVTTVDFDFLFPKTTRNLAKLKAIARGLRAMVLRPITLHRTCIAWCAMTTACRSISWQPFTVYERLKASAIGLPPLTSTA